MITSRSNSQLKDLTKLMKKTGARREAQTYVIEGKKMFFELLSEAPELLIKAYWAESALSGLSAAERELVANCDFETVSDSVFDAVAETVTPQGVLALVKMPRNTVEELADTGKNLLLLETIQDPGNLGTMLRTAEAAGFGGIILSADSVDAYSPKVVRATMGAVFRVPFVYAEDFPGMLKKLQARGYRLFAAHLKGSVSYDEADYRGKAGILIGNEGNGLTEEAAAACDMRVRIPMEGKAESLNAAVAAAILMYEAKKAGQ